MLVGVGLLVVAGYMVWQDSQKKSFANATASKKAGLPKEVENCQRLCKNSSDIPACMGDCLNKSVNAW